MNEQLSSVIRCCNFFCFNGSAAAAGLRRTNSDIGVTISKARPERFPFSLPLLQSQKRFLPTFANKAFEIIRPARCSPLIRSDMGDLAKKKRTPDKSFQIIWVNAFSKSVFKICARLICRCTSAFIENLQFANNSHIDFLAFLEYNILRMKCKLEAW